MTLKEMQHPWIQKAPNRYNALEMEYFLGAVEKHKVTRFDNRRLSGAGDSYIIKVTK
jgi:hypothetical protein